MASNEFDFLPFGRRAGTLVTQTARYLTSPCSRLRTYYRYSRVLVTEK